MPLSSCVQTTLNGEALIEIEVQPGSSRQGIIGFNEWRGKLQIAVKADAQKGMANNAVCAVLSTIFGTKVEVVSGHKTRLKKIRVHNMDAGEILTVLGDAIES